LRSERPYAVISMGLALLPALTAKFASAREALASELPNFLENEMGAVLTRRCTAVKERILAEAGNEFFRKKLRPLLEEFRRGGGSLASLRRRLDERLAAEAPLLRESLGRILPLVLPGLAEETRELAARWFARHGVTAPPGRVSLSSGNGGKEDSISLEISGMDGVVNVLAGVLGSLVTAGTALLCGGSGADLYLEASIGGADLFVTADVKYHQVEAILAEGLALAVIDHGEMERVSLPALARGLASRVGCDVAVSDDRALPVPFGTVFPFFHDRGDGL
ncbi:MAG: hypothetical protein EOM65_15795, partial [Synergistales bacterium]|nr:hypothetical protein [Synergistales bacterium]